MGQEGNALTQKVLESYLVPMINQTVLHAVYFFLSEIIFTFSLAQPLLELLVLDSMELHKQPGANSAGYCSWRVPVD